MAGGTISFPSLQRLSDADGLKSI